MVRGADDLEALADELYVWGGCLGSAVPQPDGPPTTAYALLEPLFEGFAGRQR